MFNIEIEIEERKILGKILVDSYFFEKSKYDYAFYLYQNNERIDSAWYSESMEVEFSLDGLSGSYYVKAFIRDKNYGDKRTFDSKKITIDS